MEAFVTPYRICASIFIKVYSAHRSDREPTENGRLCLFILDIIRQNEYPFRQLNELIHSKCENAFIIAQFMQLVEDSTVDINNLFEVVKQMRECPNVESNSVAGLYLRKLAIYFEKLTHQACSQLFDDLIAYVTCAQGSRRRGQYVMWQTPRTTRSSNQSSMNMNITPSTPISTSTALNSPGGTPLHQSSKPVHQIHHEIMRLQTNESRAMNPKELYESLRRPTNSSKSDASFLRYLNLLRVNESVGSKHLLMAYFDMVSDSVSRSYSALNYAIWYLHHGEFKRAIECLQECYCCAQAADDDKCLLISLMWLSRIVIQAKQKNSSKYNVSGLLDLVRRRSQKAGMAYVQAMASMTLEQLNGPIDDSEQLKKSSETLKQVALNSKQQNHLLTCMNQPNPLDNDDQSPSAEVLAVRNSMNDVLAMYYALVSAHFSLMDANHSSALASQVLLHFDLIEKCGNEDVPMMNENIFIAIRNLAYHVWNSTRDINLVREILVDLCSSNIPLHRTDHHSIWRQALSEISFEYYIEQCAWSEALKMVAVIRETDQDGAQLREAELLNLMGEHEEALYRVDDLITRIEDEESNLTDPVAMIAEQDGKRGCGSIDGTANDLNALSHPSLPIEHKAFVKAKALLLKALLIDEETKISECLNYANENKFLHIRTACLLQLAKHWVDRPDKIMDSIVIELFANGTLLERRQLRQMLADRNRRTELSQQ